MRDSDGREVVVTPTCLRYETTTEAARMVGLFAHYRAGFLPRAGGIEDQTHRYGQAMAVIGAHVAFLEELRIKEMERKQRR